MDYRIAHDIFLINELLADKDSTTEQEALQEEPLVFDQDAKEQGSDNDKYGLDSGQHKN